MWMVYALCASALWGLEYVLLGRLFNDRISPLFLLSIQMLVGAIALGSVCLLTGTFSSEVGNATRNWTVILQISFSAVVFTLGSFFIAISIQEGNPLLAGLVEISYPLFILIFSLSFGFSETISFRTLLGGFTVIVGILILQSAK
jgi:drug/metabolite transporter (DMT)-like permease